MNSRIEDILIYVNYIFFSGILLFISIFNIERFIYVITCSFLFLASYTIRTYVFYKSKSKFFVLVSIFFEIAMIFLLNLNDRTYISLALYFFIIGDIVLSLTSVFSILLCFGLFMVYSAALLRVRNFDIARFIPGGVISIPIFIALFIIFFLLKSVIQKNEITESSLKEITLKKVEMDNLYSNLKKAYEKVEMMTLLRERNKISREIHDTVGHTLTTVLVELEAGKRLMSKDLNLAYEKLNLAQEQVRKGLNDIRSSVRLLEKGEDIMDFYSSLEALIKDTELHSEVVIRSQVDTSLQLKKETENVIFSAVTEGLANGIRHGKSTAFLFKLYKEGEALHFFLQDNGIGAGTLNLGFGLRAMRDRVKDLGGEFEISSEKDEGFEIDISIPVNRALISTKVDGGNDEQN